MAISRMQQPRQMYGLGSFVKKAVRKVTRPFTKVAKKLVPKEVAGIMRAAAPFLPAGYREAAYLLGTAKQTGRISPVDLALTAAPTFFSKTTTGQNLADQFKTSRLGKFLVGSKGTPGRIETIQRSPMGGTMTLEGVGARDATSGIFGKGGEFFQLGKGTLPGTGPKQDFGILDTKAGKFLLGGEDGGFSKAKLAGVGLSTLSLIQSAKTPDEAGEALASATGNSDDYERGVQLFSQLTPELFAVPEQFRAKDGGRIGFDQGSPDPTLEELRPPRPGSRRGLGSMALDMAADPKSDFFTDLFLNRAGGGGRDFILPMEASERKDLTEGMIFGANDMAKAKELEAERIFPSLYSKAMTVIDAIQDIDNEETKMKMLNDVNKSFDRTEGFGYAKAANAYYRIIQKYGYLLDKPEGLGSMIRDLGQDPLDSRKPERAGGGIMRTNYATGSDDPKPLPNDPTEPVNPFKPKPIGPVLPDKKMASDDTPGFELEELRLLIDEFEEDNGRGPVSIDELKRYFKIKYGSDRISKMEEKGEGIMMAGGGRVNYALGTRPTAEESGLGGLPIEADMRYTGGFMPYGAKEKADDVPARLSKNEFVFTADAVRAAGGGNVNEGAKKMYATMKQLEKKPEAKGMMA